MRASLQPVVRLIESEIAEMEFLGRKSPAYLSDCVAGMMPHSAVRSNRISNLASYLIFTSSSGDVHGIPDGFRR